MLRPLRASLVILLVLGAAKVGLAQGLGKGHATSNSVKYKNAGVRPATGRSGSASLETRALIAKAGTMQVEAATGSLESGTNPGNIDKAQVKILVGSTPANNYNNLTGGGYWTATYPTASRGDQVQVQANISGIDGRRTDVVTATARASLRPDLTVRSVTGAAQAAPRAAVSFAAAVSEINGDVGARASCVLSINGTRVDSADGIWVDAGGTVSCRFTHVFDSPGTYAVGVAATNVNPADWDAANNSATTSITITQPGQPLATGYMGAAQHNTREYREGANTGGSFPYNYRDDYRVDYSYAYLYGWDRGFAAGGMQRVDATLYANSAVSHTASLVPTVTYDYDDGYYYQRCAQYYSGSWNSQRYVSSGDYAWACSSGYHSDPGSQRTVYSYQRISGEVTYYGQRSYCDYLGCNSYTWNYDYSYGSGADLGWTAGSAIRLKLNFVDAAGVSHTADRTVTLQDDSRRVNYSYSGSYYDWYRGGTTSYSYWSSGFYAWGQVWWP